MNLRRAIAGGTIAIGMAMTAHNAHAAVVTVVTYTGTVAMGGIDSAGLFGTVGADLSGASFTATYTTSDILGASTQSTAVNSTIYGGSLYGTPPVTTATVTINGDSIYFDGGWNGEQFQQILSGQYTANISSTSYGDTNGYYVQNYLFSTSTPFVTTSDYHSPPNYTIHNGDSVVGFGRISSSINGHTYSIDLSTVAVSSGAVPEPATWALMLGGFGLAGVALRRRRAAITA